MTFQISALPAERFAALFDLDDAGLDAHRAVRLVADATGGFPCRVSLEDADPGETLLLVNFEHQPASTPFRASHAIYVRRSAVQARPAPDEVPEQIRRRLLSIRAFDAAGMMTSADVCEGHDVATVAGAMLEDPATAYLHLHFAKQGCYAARVDRA